MIQLARRTLPLITQAWGLQPTQFLTPYGAAEMAVHFLRVELLLSWPEIALVLGRSPSPKTAAKILRKGLDWYNRWPAYHRRYHQVKGALMEQFHLHELDGLSSSE